MLTEDHGDRLYLFFHGVTDILLWLLILCSIQYVYYCHWRNGVEATPLQPKVREKSLGIFLTGEYGLVCLGFSFL